MPMVPFFTKLPDIAAVETRELIIVNNKNIMLFRRTHHLRFLLPSAMDGKLQNSIKSG